MVPADECFPMRPENLETTYFQVLEKHGFKVTEEDKTDNHQDSSTIPVAKLVDMSKLSQVGPE
jgi:hypothetical protein